MAKINDYQAYLLSEHWRSFRERVLLNQFHIRYPVYNQAYDEPDWYAEILSEEYGEILGPIDLEKVIEMGYEIHCSDCKATYPVHELHVHHLTYKNIGHELLSDVVVLCKYCHKDRHQKK